MLAMMNGLRFHVIRLVHKGRGLDGPLAISQSYMDAEGALWLL